jgi:beta-lactamase class D
LLQGVCLEGDSALRKTALTLCLLLTVLYGCGKPQHKTLDLSLYFEAHDVTGAFVLYDAGAETYTRYNPSRCTQRFIPASTFKILNAMIALETGVIADENEVIQWDGTEWPFATWNQDHTLESGMASSVVWFYQELARRIGVERMQQHVNAVGYGNQDIGGEIDSFWLEGNLRISPDEQVAFLEQFYDRKLPFADSTVSTVQEIILLEETDAYRLSGKTGWATRVELEIGWFVGYLERDENVYFFATNVESQSSQKSLGQISQSIARAVLNEMDLLPVK